jgi:hypothetical protein
MRGTNIIPEGESVTQIYDGFWLPKGLRSKLITPDTTWKVEYRQEGMEAGEGDPGVVGARWPELSHSQWEILFQYLEEQRETISIDFLSRMQKAISSLSLQMAEADQAFLTTALADLTQYTGYSPEMIHFALNVMDLTPFDTLEKALSLKLPEQVRHQFVSLQTVGGFDGWIRYYQNQKGLKAFLSRRKVEHGHLPYQEVFPHTVLGYAAGNVIGTAFLIALLAQLTALVNPGKARTNGKFIPSILIKNSREEPIFGPVLFNILEQLDPDLVRTLAVMIWDYEDDALQENIVSKADLVLAAAGDYSIGQIENVINKVNPSARFHKHGHKVSFTTIGKHYLSKGQGLTKNNLPELFEVITNLSAVDSIVWDQNGCLSSRIHFVEEGALGDHTPLEYGRNLVDKLRSLSKRLPRGRIPLGRIHDRFEFFNAQTYSDYVHLCSTYEDDFIVVVDDRPWNRQQFTSIVNNCIERTIVIRPVASIMDVPSIYLKWIEEKNLQTMYVAIDGENHDPWSVELAEFAERVGECGITGVRTIGQGPFPQLAYSWDGYLPQSLSISYPEGRFTTVEFASNYSQIIRNYTLFASIF